MKAGAGRGVFAFAVLAYVAVFWWFSPLNVQDYPNHLARARVMSDLMFHGGAEFGQNYHLDYLFTPYLLGDLCLAGLTALFGTALAAFLWTTFVFLSLPLGAFAYLRARQVSSEITLLMLLLSLYLSTDTFFLMGFTEFRVSIALVLAVLAIVEILRRRCTVASYSAFVVSLIAAYLTHLAALTFIAAAVGASAVWQLMVRKPRIGREALLMFPIVALLGWHFLTASGHRQAQDQVVDPASWGTLNGKLARLFWDFVRYTPLQDFALLGVLCGFLLLCLAFRQASNKASFVIPQVFEPWGYALLFMGVYFALPMEHTEASYIDVRALALVPFFVILGILQLPLRASMTVLSPTERAPVPASPPARRPYAGPHPRMLLIDLAAAIALANLAYLSAHFREDNAWLSRYRAVIASIPPRAAVLPVYTGGHRGSIYVNLHVPSFAVIDRQVLEPYLFSGDSGAPMKYFRYVHRPYAPDELWYLSKHDTDVDWQKVRSTYGYLLIAKPYDATRFPLAAHTVAENDVAALLAFR